MKDDMLLSTGHKLSLECDMLVIGQIASNDITAITSTLKTSTYKIIYLTETALPRVCNTSNSN